MMEREHWTRTQRDNFVELPLLILDLYSALGGTDWVPGGWSCAARRRGHKVITLEIESMFKADLCGDICEITVEQIIAACGGRIPDVVYASPPCEGFSVTVIGRNWSNWDAEKKKNAQAFIKKKILTPEQFCPVPLTESAQLGQKLLRRTLEIITALKELNPNLYWWLENPRGMMRYQREVSIYDRETITHASYHNPAAKYLKMLGDTCFGTPDLKHLPSLKPTDLWGDFPACWKPRPYLQQKYGGQLYAKAPRGAKTGIQGVKSMPHPHTGEPIGPYWIRSLIPFYLGWDTIVAVEQELGVAAPVDYTDHEGHLGDYIPEYRGFDRWFKE